MKVCEDLLNQYIHISKMKDGIFADNRQYSYVH